MNELFASVDNVEINGTARTNPMIASMYSGAGENISLGAALNPPATGVAAVENSLVR